MPEYADIYSLHMRRDRVTIDLFLELFMPLREETTDEYGIPPFAEKPTLTFPSSSELLEYCCSHLEQEHLIIWRSIGGARPEFGDVSFLSDGSMVLGLSTDSADQDLADRLCHRLSEMSGSVCSYITHEDLPPDSAVGFRAFVETLPVVQRGTDQTEIRRGRARRLA